jgi:signal transduction histidine kinase
MYGFAQLLLTENQENLQPEQKEFLRKILVSSTRLDRLIRDALDYTQVAGSPVRLEPVDITALLEGMLQSYPHLQPPNAEIRIEGQLPVVLGNEALLTQCFSNLLSNAAKFIAPGKTPQIHVSGESAGSAVRIWIHDNGIGIPKEARARIFGMFERAHLGYEGTGIGLAIVRKAVERMGGSVGVDSEPGKGSRFWVELRSAPVTAPAPAANSVTA